MGDSRGRHAPAFHPSDGRSISPKRVGWSSRSLLTSHNVERGETSRRGTVWLRAGHIVLSAYMVSLLAFRHPDAYNVDHGLDLRVISESMVGAGGFLCGMRRRPSSWGTRIPPSLGGLRRWARPDTQLGWASSAGSRERTASSVQVPFAHSTRSSVWADPPLSLGRSGRTTVIIRADPLGL